MCKIRFSPFHFLSVTTLSLLFNSSVLSWVLLLKSGGNPMAETSMAMERPMATVCQMAASIPNSLWHISPSSISSLTFVCVDPKTIGNDWKRLSLTTFSPRSSRLHCLRDPPNCHPAQCPKSLPNRPRLSQQHFKLQNHREHSPGGWAGAGFLPPSLDDYWQKPIGYNSLQMLSLIRRRR